MDVTLLFTAALGLTNQWYVTSVNFEDVNGTKELHIQIDFHKGAKFECPCEECTETTGAYDTENKTWRHLNFFQYKTYITARVPRIKCSKHNVKSVIVPWARAGSGFTLMFEAWVVLLAQSLPVAQIEKMTGEHDTRIWRVVKHYVDKALALEDRSSVTAIGVDETSRKGHSYITSFVDLSESKVLYVTTGKDAETVTDFVEDFKSHNGDPDKVRVVTCDMSPAFMSGINKSFPKANTIIDKFHVIKLANEAVDKVRKEEVKSVPELKKSKYLWLKNATSLTQQQTLKFNELKKLNLKTARAYAMKTSLQDIYSLQLSKTEAETTLRKFLSWLMHSNLEPMKACARSIRQHFQEILNYFQYRKTNAVLEGVNSIIQNIKRRSRGFRNIEFFKTAIYLTCGKLNFDLCKL